MRIKINGGKWMKNLTVAKGNKLKPDLPIYYRLRFLA